MNFKERRKHIRKLYFGKVKQVLKYKPTIIIKYEFILDLFQMQ